MKLISLYIENFGGLSCYELQFESALTVIKAPNGFGKTTLAEFIRAMLYGFPRKAKALEKSKRQKYAPWGGGVFGGNLTFEHEGVPYRLERTFGATPKGDTFSLTDLRTNSKSSRFSEEIGIQLFGLDSDSFERSTYLPQVRDDGILTTAAIQAKLSDLVEDSSDIGNYDRAIDALKAKRSTFVPYRGSGGLAAQADGMVTKLQMQLDQALLQQRQLLSAQEDAARTEQEIRQMQADLERCQEELTAASEMAAIAARQRQYQELKDQCRQAAARLEAYQQRYPAGIPDEQALQVADAMADRLAFLTAQHTAAREDARLQWLPQEHACFETRLPERDELEENRRKCGEYEALQAKIQNAQQCHREFVQERQLLDGQKTPKSNAWICTAAIAIGGICIVAGAALLYLQELLFGGIGLGVGAVALVLGLILLLGQRKKRQLWEAELQAKKDQLDEQITAAQQELSVLCQTSDGCCAEVAAYLGAFGIAVPPRHFLMGLTELEHRAQQYVQAKAQQARVAQCEKALDDSRKKLAAFFAQYSLATEQDVRLQLRQLREDSREEQAAQNLVQRLKQQIAALEAECGEILATELCTTADPRLLKAREQRQREALTEKTAGLLRLQQRVQLLRAQAEQLPQLREDLAHWQQEKADAREKAKLLDDTMDFLQKAKESLSASYLGTIKSRFAHYLSELEDATDGKFLIDTSLQVQLERQGQARELAYFSAGQTDLVLLCMRLSLVDALFKEQDTFVVLDDPFVNMDDAHTAQALALLRAISGSRQILYLTCHSSRTV